MASPEHKQTLYFGYGSNLWKSQMSQRCPDSTYLGLARLTGWRWIINERGYANVVEASSTFMPKEGGDVVWGLVYSLSDSDERKLDVNEGVPFAYTKEIWQVDFWAARGGGGKSLADVEGGAPERREALVYVDRVRVGESEAKREYVYRMNMGIADAVAEGMPGAYVESVMRAFIPADRDDHDEEVRRLAKKQAGSFVEEG